MISSPSEWVIRFDESRARRIPSLLPSYAFPFLYSILRCKQCLKNGSNDIKCKHITDNYKRHTTNDNHK